MNRSVFDSFWLSRIRIGRIFIESGLGVARSRLKWKIEARIILELVFKWWLFTNRNQDRSVKSVIVPSLLRSVHLIIRDLINYQPLTVQRLDTYRSVLIARLLVSSTVQYGESLTAGRLDWSEMNFIDQTNKYPLYPLWCLPDVIL